jgi:hypothetical protein
MEDYVFDAGKGDPPSSIFDFPLRSYQLPVLA